MKNLFFSNVIRSFQIVSDSLEISMDQVKQKTNFNQPLEEKIKKSPGK